LPQPAPDALLVRVYYEDTDFSGRVYHASYLRFLERGRTEWLRGRGLAHSKMAEDWGLVFAVRSLKIDYLAPALMDDLLRVETSVAAARGASIEFRQLILRGDKELASAAFASPRFRTDARRGFQPSYAICFKPAREPQEADFGGRRPNLSRRGFP
jgi:acyl-CoA thioester hydrolase